MQYSQIILNYIENMNITPYKLSKDTGISESTFSKWKSKPTSDISFVIIDKISQYFGISYDYLLTGQKSPSKNLTQEQIEWLELIDKLDRDKQLEFKGELKGYIRAKEETAKSIPKQEVTDSQSDMVSVYRAARSDNNAKPEIVDMPRSRIDRLKTLPRVTKEEDF